MEFTRGNSARVIIPEEEAGFYHRFPPRHPRFSSTLQQGERQRTSHRWSTEMGILTPPPGLQASVKDSATGVVADHTSAVESFFASIRVPASFLAATSFSELFAVELNRDDTSIQRQLQTLCLICQGVSFILSMNVIVFCTQALTRSLTGDFDPMAETGYEFLFREFHFEFVSV